MRLKKRWFTILIVPHSGEHSFSFKLPLFVLQALAILSVLGIVCFLVLINQYRNVLDQAGEARRLRETNRIQQQMIDRFAEETEHLLEKMDPVEKLAELLTERAEELGIPITEEDETEEETEGGENSPEDN